MITIEEEIVYYAVQGTAKCFAKAISLIKSGDFNRKTLVRHGRKMRATGRLYGALFVAEGLMSGKIDKSKRTEEIRRLAACTGNAVRTRTVRR